jgi:photosystem II stability/assembly factor-like uncharacterized protein
MVRIFLTTILLAALQPTAAGAQVWAQQSGLPSSTTVQVLAADPGSPGVLYAGTISGGAYQRSAAGVWTVVSNDFVSDTITSIAVSPANSNIILLGTEGFGAHRSGDGGKTWSPVPAGGRVAFVRMFRFSSANPLQVLAATEGQGVYQSIDAGVDWTVISPDVQADFSRDVIFHSTDPRTLFASASGIDDVPMRESTDGGASWQRSGTGITSTVTSLAIGVTSPDVVYAGTESGVFVSENGASTFSLRPFVEGEPTEVRAIAVDPSNHLRIFAATNKGVFMSESAGESWLTLNTGLPTEDVRALVMSPANPNQLFIGVALDGVLSLTLVPMPLVDVDADFDESGSVDFSDFLTFVTGFGKTSTEEGFDVQADLDSNGSIDFSDFLLFAAVFGT